MSDAFLALVSQEGIEYKNVEEVMGNGENSWEGWFCSAGRNNLYIDYDGNVFVCNNASSKLDRFNYAGWEQRIEELKKSGVDLLTPESYESGLYQKHQRIFEKSGNGFSNELDYYDEDNHKENWGYLGSIYQRFHLSKKMVVCPYKKCGCGSDIPIAKSKSKEFLTKYLLFGEKVWEGLENKTLDSFSFIGRRGGIVPTILWDLGRRCNYDCSYCWPAVHNAKEAHKDMEVIIAACEKIIKEFCPGVMKLFSFSGGEPTLHPNIREILKYINDNGHRCLLTTNGSLKPECWQELVPFIGDIQMSAHFEFLNSERFIKNIEIALKEVLHSDLSKNLCIKLMTPPGKIGRSLELKDEILRSSVYKENIEALKDCFELSLVPLRSIENSEELLTYSDEELRYF